MDPSASSGSPSSIDAERHAGRVHRGALQRRERQAGPHRQHQRSRPPPARGEKAAPRPRHAYNDKHPRGRKFQPDELQLHKKQWPRGRGARLVMERGEPAARRRSAPRRAFHGRVAAPVAALAEPSRCALNCPEFEATLARIIHEDSAHFADPLAAPAVRPCSTAAADGQSASGAERHAAGVRPVRCGLGELPQSPHE